MKRTFLSHILYQIYARNNESLGSFFRAEFAKIAITSLAVRVGSTSRIRATTPETNGVADEVPPKLGLMSPAS